MQLLLQGHAYRYECENLCRLFAPYHPVKVVEQLDKSQPYASTVVVPLEEGVRYTVELQWENKQISQSEVGDTLAEYPMTDLLYRCFSTLTGYYPSWGMLTGIHPVKLLRTLCEGAGKEAGERQFQEKFHVSPRKLSLAARTLAAQQEAVSYLQENDFSLYISIPFCPTRCAYCSFVSQSIEKAAKLVEPYYDLLLLEIKKTAEVTRELGLHLASVYIGGGTPTTLSASQLFGLCSAIHQAFDMVRCREFTVEAGRPDTITQDKLRALSQGGCTRISINPQTLSDTVLEAIGRKHTTQEVREAFALAAKEHFSVINADLIVGLPLDTPESFRASLEGVLELGASNVTVHSLALKKSANLVAMGGDLTSHSHKEAVEEMMEYSIDRLSQEGYQPYYLYRQTRMAGNLENTGWAKPGTACYYNVYTMDECGSVIACGAGGVTKLKDPYSDRLERIFNFKYPFEYISRNSEILERKDGVITLYEQFRQRLY